ncbi:MAG: winged helix DNA-binding domain-containing protein [Chloroflexota bacterium]|nr:MAG: winged helix DNA-binding domain-containing protein [Chloroflexota bacterium]
MKAMISPDQTRLLRLKAQRLLHAGRSKTTPEHLIKDVFGVQAQELPAALLSVRARSKGLTASSVEKARQTQGSIAWTWCMRGTLHLVSAEDARWLAPFLGPGMVTSGKRRLRQLGWEEDRLSTGIRLVEKALSKQGELTRPEIVDLLKENDLPSKGQAPVHLLFRMAAEGILCRGPDKDGNHTFVLFEPWVGRLQPMPEEEALSKMAQRYLNAYAPARPEDLAAWSGLKAGEARKAWQLIADQLVEVELTGLKGSEAQPAWLLKEQLAWLDERLDSEPVVRLLPRFDTYLLGYAKRDLAVEPAYAKRIQPGGGIIHQALIVNGQALGTWTSTQKKDTLQVRVEPFKKLPPELTPLIEAEVADLGRFLGLEAELKT